MNVSKGKVDKCAVSFYNEFLPWKPTGRNNYLIIIYNLRDMCTNMHLSISLLYCLIWLISLQLYIYDCTTARLIKQGTSTY